MDGLSGLFLPKEQKASSAKVADKVLSSSSLEVVSQELRNAVKTLGGAPGKVVLIVDQLDLLLAAGGEIVGAVKVGEMLMSLREVCALVFKIRIGLLIYDQEVHSTIVSLSADLPLVTSHQTLLEADHAAFLLRIAHQADFTISLRLLDSGTARDVSGVVRVTMGDGAVETEEDIRKRVEEKELLYFVGGDGGVKVFERGQ